MNKSLVVFLILSMILAACEPVKEGTCTIDQARAVIANENNSVISTQSENANQSIPVTDSVKSDQDKEEPTSPKPSSPTDSNAGTKTAAPDANPDEVPPGPVSTSILDYIPKKQVFEGDLVRFPNLAAVDPDGDPLTYRFTKPLNSKGEWQTRRGDAGEYKAIITVTDGKTEQSQEILIVVKKVNFPPAIYAPKTIELREGERLEAQWNATDVNNDPITWSYSGYTTTLPKDIGFDQAGTHNLTIEASDGEKSTKQIVIIKVLNVNRPPIPEPIAPIEAMEGELVKVSVKASDADNDPLTVLFSTPLNKSGAWKTRKGDAGEYMANISVGDTYTLVRTNVSIKIKIANHKPVLAGVQDLYGKEGETVRSAVTATDQDGDNVTITYTGFMNSMTKTLSYDTQGTHEVVVRASDGKDEVRETFKVVVEDVNRAPKFGPNAFK